MNESGHERSAAGFTLVEMLTVIAIIGLLVALLLPALSRAKMQAKRAACVNNLQEMGLAFHVFAHDHNNNFPMRVPVSDGGAAEFPAAFRSFQTLANELKLPEILICPADLRVPAKNFASLKNENVSYFVARNAEFGKTTSVLAGDRNLSISPAGAGKRLRWTAELHQFKGNVLFADGHVEKLNNLEIGVAANGSVDLSLPANDPSSPPARSSACGGSSSSSSLRANNGGLNSPSIPGISTPSVGRTNSPGGQPVPALKTLPPPSNNPVGVGRQSSSLAPATRATVVIIANEPQGHSQLVAKEMSAPGVAIQPNETADSMSPFDKRLARILSSVLIWSYLLLLLLLLLYIVYRLWCRWYKKQEQAILAESRRG